MSKSLGNSLLIPAVLRRVRGIELRFSMVSAHYRSQVEFSFEALDEAAAAFRRIEGFLDRAGDEDVPLGQVGLPDAFAAAMDDDLGTPAAVAAIHEAVRDGNRQLADGDRAGARETATTVRAMLDVLGLDPRDPAWGPAAGGGDQRLAAAVDALVEGLLAERAQARAAKDFAHADAIRDRLRAAGVDIEDTPEGPQWTLDGH
jgi:cysteinyl-tRNA synthetase